MIATELTPGLLVLIAGGVLCLGFAIGLVVGIAIGVREEQERLAMLGLRRLRDERMVHP